MVRTNSHTKKGGIPFIIFIIGLLVCTNIVISQYIGGGVIAVKADLSSDSSTDTATTEDDSAYTPDPVVFTQNPGDLESWNLEPEQLIEVVDQPLSFNEDGSLNDSQDDSQNNATSTTSLQRENNTQGSDSIEPATEEEPTLSAAELELQRKLDEREKKQKKIVDKLIEKFSSKKMTERDLKTDLEDNRARYTALHERLTSLYKQVKELDNEIKDTEHQIEILDKKIDILRDDINQAKDEISDKEDEIKVQEQAIQQYILAMYANGQNDTLDILLSGKTLGDVVYELEVMSVLEEQGQLMFARLNELKDELQNELEALQTKKDRLDDTNDSKRNKSKELKQQKKAKDELISLTKGKEEAYQQLIEDAKDEQEQINSDLENLKDQLVLFDAKEKVYEIERNYYDFGDKLGKVSDVGLMWPVDPARGITAFFKDPSYKAALGVQHYAIDVRAPMQTPIMAAQDGYVYKAKDNGFGYSYIVLLHTPELATVYGHIYEFNDIQEGDYVEQGQIIGYTGGQPGTKGAGFLTTGPHLHFEVRVNGVAQDPLDFLP